jgi:hypothetical protein
VGFDSCKTASGQRAANVCGPAGAPHLRRDLKQNIENFYDGSATTANAREPGEQKLAAVEAMALADGLR